MEGRGVLQSVVWLEPASKGACLRLANGKPLVMDGPFTESKELLGGFVILQLDSLQEAVSCAERYQSVVGAEEVAVRLISEA